MKQITILTENRVGVLANIATLLGKHGVNIESITAETFPDSAVIRVITKDVNTAKKILQDANYNVIESDIVVLKLLDRPGELGKVATILANEGVNIENIYLITRNHDYALLALRVDDPEKTKELFRNNIVE